MAASNWRSSLGFMARLTAVTQITTALQGSDAALSAGHARQKATTAEAEIYDHAQSEADYERLCQLRIAHVPPTSLELPGPEDDEYVPTPDGRAIGKYQNAAYHREGLFSVIYKAPALDNDSYFPTESSCHTRVVALKVTTPSVMEPPHDSRREAIILRRVASTNVIPLLDTFREGGSHFILVFPFMRYELGELLQDKGVSRAQGKSYLRDMFSGLNYIHTQGVIHRDIKPANILLKSVDGPAYLSDFGISWAPNDTGSEPSDQKITDVGTTCYRPPELLFGNKHYGCSLDLWAAGCTAAEVLTPTHQTLFDSGELGSDLALIQSMFKKLGTPNLDVWPEAANLPDWGKVQFHEYPAQGWAALLPDLDDDGRDLVGSLVKYESGARLTCSKALGHPFFAQ